MKLKCVVVDDESMGRKLLEENIKQIPFLELVASCKNAFDAMEVLHEKEVDLMFLDIQMPGMMGTQFLNTLPIKPMVIMVTAYPQYALEGFELDVVDYLVKPVGLERFSKAVQKALTLADLKDKPKSAGVTENEEKEDYFFVNVEYSLVKIPVKEITHIEGMKDYVKIFLETQAKPVITKATLKSIEERLPEEVFMRVHKSYIANIQKIDAIKSHILTINDREVPVSETNMSMLLDKLNYKQS